MTPKVAGDIHQGEKGYGRSSSGWEDGEFVCLYVV